MNPEPTEPPSESPGFSPLRAADHPARYRSLDLDVGPALAYRIDGLPPRFHGAFARFLAHFVTQAEPDDPILIQTYGRPSGWAPAMDLLFEGDHLRLWQPAEKDADGVGLPGNPSLLIESSGVVGWCERGPTRAGLLIDEDSPPGAEDFGAQLLVPLLFELALDRGWLGAHAAAVSLDGRGVLLPAASGSGKSTLFQQAAAAGFDLLSDDLVWLRRHDGGWWIDAFPRGLPWAETAGPTIDGAPLAAIVAPFISRDAETRVEACAAGDLLDLMLPEAGVIRSSSRAGVGFRRAVELAGSVPAFRLAVGWQRSGIESLRTIVESL